MIPVSASAQEESFLEPLGGLHSWGVAKGIVFSNATDFPPVEICVVDIEDIFSTTTHSSRQHPTEIAD